MGRGEEACCADGGVVAELDEALLVRSSEPGPVPVTAADDEDVEGAVWSRGRGARPGVECASWAEGGGCVVRLRWL